jgi:hypothetical protein
MASRKLSKVSGHEKEKTTANVRLVFEHFRGTSSGIDNRTLVRFAEECGIVGGTLAAKDVDLMFARVKVGKKQELNLDRFTEALRQMSVAKEMTYTELVGMVCDTKGIGGGADVGLSVDPSTLSIREIKRLLDEQGISYADCVEKRDMVARLTQHVGTAKVTGLTALRMAAKNLLDDVEKTEFEVCFEEKRSLGISLERSNEWAITKVAPQELEIGSALCRVNGESVLLKTYAEAMTLLKHASWPLNMRFRRAPSKEGVLWKRSRGRTGSARNWKKRYFKLSAGTLEYYTKEGAGGELKGQYVLENDPGSQTMVTMAPDAVMGKGEQGIMLVKGEDRLVLKAHSYADLMDWGAKLYYAVAFANGGNPDMLEAEQQRLIVIQSEEHAKRWKEESLRAMSAQKESMDAYHREQEAQQEKAHAEEAQAQAVEAQKQAEAAHNAAEAARQAQLVAEAEKKAAEAGESAATAAGEKETIKKEAAEEQGILAAAQRVREEEASEMQAQIDHAKEEQRKAEAQQAVLAETAVLAEDAKDGVASATVDAEDDHADEDEVTITAEEAAPKKKKFEYGAASDWFAM